MATYNTIPNTTPAEEALLQQPKTSMSRKGLAGAAVASFVLAMVAVTALTSSVGTSSPGLGAFSAGTCRCDHKVTLPLDSGPVEYYEVKASNTCVVVNGDNTIGDYGEVRVKEEFSCARITVKGGGIIRRIRARSRVPFRPPHRNAVTRRHAGLRRQREGRDRERRGGLLHRGGFRGDRQQRRARRDAAY